MKRLSLLFVTIFSLCLYYESLQAHIVNEDSLYDVFPLRPGIRYSYSYSYDGSGGDLIYETVNDSGQIEYLVIDSTSINDSIRIWNVIEIHNYQRQRHTNSPSETPDTSYFVGDSIEFFLYENLWGKHELRCFTRIWQFPLYHDFYQIHEAIYRYMNTTDVQLGWTWDNWGSITGGKGYDTVHFSIEYGFKGKRFHEIWTNAYNSGHDNLTAEALHVPLTIYENNRNIQLPKRLHLKQNYPNPFNPGTTFLFYLENRGYASLKLYNILGQEILTIKEGEFLSGENTIQWNAYSISGGVYLCRLKTKEFTETIKILLLK